MAHWPDDQARWLALLLEPGLQSLLTAQLGGALQSLRPWWWWAVPCSGGRSAMVDPAGLNFCDVAAGGQLLEAGSVLAGADPGSIDRWLKRRAIQDGAEARSVLRLNWGDADSAPPQRAAAGDFAFADWVHDDA